MRVLYEIGAALWWVGVIGGGLAFLAWVGDRLHTQDMGTNVYPVPRVTPVPVSQIMEAPSPGESVIHTRDEDVEDYLLRSYITDLWSQDWDSEEDRAYDYDRDVEDPAPDTVD